MLAVRKNHFELMFQNLNVGRLWFSPEENPIHLRALRAEWTAKFDHTTNHAKAGCVKQFHPIVVLDRLRIRCGHGCSFQGLLG